MYQKDTSVFLRILQYTNLAIIFLFLLLFTYRLQTLRSYSLTDKFKNYFPKMRIFFCLAYIALSASLLAYNVVTDSYSETVWYEYVLQGGGGECIDSIILFIQLGVLRLQLQKEQPYTPFHLWYFVYLMVMSLARFTLTLLDTIQKLNDAANLIISLLLVADSAGQFGYWIKNRQSLPQFINHTHKEIDQSRYQSQFLQKRAELAKRSMHTVSNDRFPYISAFVTCSNGKIRLNLERNVIKSASIDVFTDNNDLNQSILDRQTHQNQEFVVSNEYTTQQIKKFYTICGRYQLKRQLNFLLDMRSFIKQLQRFLNELFLQKKCYTLNILKFLKVPPEIVASYQHILQKMYLSESVIDVATGLQIIPDRNGLYFSLNLYRFMWVCDHYEFYMKIAPKEEGEISYPIKRIQEIQQLHHVMKKKIKTQGKAIELPSLPKMPTFMVRQDDLLKQHINDVEIFLRKMINDDSIMDDPQLREKIMQFLGYEKGHKVIPKFNQQFFSNLKILKGRISKALIKHEYVTLYEFKLTKSHFQGKNLMKRFRQIDALHHDIQKWMKGRKASMSFSLPEKVVYRTQIRHQKLKNYLQNVIQIKDIWKSYAASAFFDVGQSQQNQSSFMSSKAQQKPQKQRYTFNNASLMADLQSFTGQMDRSVASSRSSKMFSKIMDDLGNEEYD